MIFCAAGDPGGSRALMPVIDELTGRGHECRILDHGFLGRELRAGLRAGLCSVSDGEDRLAEAKGFLFGSSATDATALILAEKAGRLGLPTLHVLDNWSGYRQRLTTGGREAFFPDIYAVMDEEAYKGAADEGIPENRLRITGHPGLNYLATLADRRRQRPSPEILRSLGLPEGKTILAFVNEPLKQVLGEDVSRPGHYGFTEGEVLSRLASALRTAADHIYVIILPHPKDDDDELAELWSKTGGGLDGRVLRLSEGQAILPIANGLAGMASILLYSSWLVGLPTLVMQPGCRAEPIRRFSRLDDINYTAKADEIPQEVGRWLQKTKEWRARPRPELALHVSAPAVIADLLENLMENR